MRGPNQTVTVYGRSGSGGWSTTGSTWKCYIDPISRMMVVDGETTLVSMHRAIGDNSTIVSRGSKLTVGTRTFLVTKTQDYSRPGVGAHHQEVWMREIERP